MDDSLDHPDDHTDDIPPLVPPHEVPPLRTQADLARFWRMIRGPHGFDEPQIWMEVLASDGRCQGVLMNLTELPAAPDGLPLENLFASLRIVLADELIGGSVAFLYARPGAQPITDQDRAWARALTGAAADAGVPCRPVHFGNDQGVRVFAPDDMGDVAA